MRVHLFFFFFVVESHGDYNLFMPDLPSSSSSVIRRFHYSFRRLHLAGGPMSVRFTHRSRWESNDTSIVEIEAEDSLHPFIHLEINQNDQLVIRTDDEFQASTIQVNILYEHFDELHLDGWIDTECLTPIPSEHFRLFARGSGSVRLKFNVTDLEASLYSMGEVKLCGLVRRQATIRSFGLANVQCRHLWTRSVDLLSAGIGNVFVSGTEELKVNLTGVGTVSYRGPLKEQSRTGLGQLVNVES